VTAGEPAPRHRLGLALLFLVAAGISAAIMLKGMQPNDEGLMLQAAERIADGELPYRDFWWFYPPGQPYLLAGLSEIFGPSLLAWRIVRVLVNATVALLVYVLARREAPRGLALLAWAVTAVSLAAPTGPHPYPLALAFALGCLLLLDRPALAGALVGACSLWRIEFAAYLGLGVLLGYLVRPGPGGRGAALRFAGASLLTAAVMFAPVVIPAGIRRSWDLLIRYPIEDFSDYQSLPFPRFYNGPVEFGSVSAARDTIGSVLSFQVPLLLLLALAAVLAALALRFRRETWHHVPVAVFAIGMAHYLVTRPDAFHVTPLAVALAAPTAWVLADAHATLRASDRALRPLLRLAAAPVVGVVALWLVLDGVQRVERQWSSDMVPVRIDVADGVRELPVYNCSLPGAPAQTCTLGDLERAVGYVREQVPPDRPIYVATQRSDLVTSGAPLLYVLTERRSASRYDIAAPGVITSAPVQREIVASLESKGLPLVLRWNASITAAPEPNRAGRSTGVRILDDFFARRYRRSARFGAYDVLESSPQTPGRL
jgi:hypothetical protein